MLILQWWNDNNNALAKQQKPVFPSLEDEDDAGKEDYNDCSTSPSNSSRPQWKRVSFIFLCFFPFCFIHFTPSKHSTHGTETNSQLWNSSLPSFSFLSSSFLFLYVNELEGGNGVITAKTVTSHQHHMNEWLLTITMISFCSSLSSQGNSKLLGKVKWKQKRKA